MTCDCQSSPAPCDCPPSVFDTIGVGRQRSRTAPGVRVGKLERSSPLPAGTYWIDVIDTQNQTDFGAWTLENAANVKVLKTEHFPANDWPTCSGLDPTTGGCWPARDWVKFQLLKPVTWDAIKFGFPNIIEAGEKVDSSADTASSPDFSDNCDIGCQAEKVAVAGGVILGGVAVILIIQSLRH